MLLRHACLAAILASGVAAPAMAQPLTQTLILIRHGEKPEAGLGQLSCAGLNRALRLPAVLRRDYGAIDAIFAPNPAKLKKDGGERYAYVRPLATVEPTAIALGLPVQASYGYRQTGKLARALEADALAGKTALVAWEHKELVTLARKLLERNGADPALAPDWPKDEFDAVYVLRIERDGARRSARFERRWQGLNGQAAACPQG